jgi:hypothetical protein
MGIVQVSLVFIVENFICLAHNLELDICLFTLALWNLVRVVL